MAKKEIESEKKGIDWEAVERDFRANVKSVLQIGKEHGISHTAINKRFKKLGVTRDLTEKIKAKAESLVSMDAVSTEVSTETKVSEVEIINANAELQVAVRREHRKGLTESRELFGMLMAELKAECIDPSELERFAEMLAHEKTAGIDNPEKREKATEEALATFRKLISLPTRAGTFDKLINSLTRLIALDRAEFGIGPELPKPPEATEYRRDPVLAGELRRIQGAFFRAEYADGRVVSVQ